MTTMGLNYLVYEETKRSNLAREGENFRSNTAREKENFRSAVASLVETVQHNRNTENLGWGQLSEQSRSNRARETESHRANTAQEGIKGRELEERRYQYDIDNLSVPLRAWMSQDRRGIPQSDKELDSVYQAADWFRGWIPLLKD